MGHGFGRRATGYTSFSAIRGAFVEWLKNGAGDQPIHIVPDGKGPHSAQWLLAVISHSDEPLTERERRVFEEWLGTTDPYIWAWVTNLPRSTVLTFRTVTRLMARAGDRERWTWSPESREC